MTITWAPSCASSARAWSGVYGWRGAAWVWEAGRANKMDRTSGSSFFIGEPVRDE
ncbi:hypothetical protein D9M69_716390 [compost metagenome]